MAQPDATSALDFRPATRAYGWTVAALLAVIAAIKRKAIAAGYKRAKGIASQKFCGWVNNHVEPAQHPKLKTYKETFQGCVYITGRESASLYNHYFEVPQHGVLTKFPCMDTVLLAGHKRGDEVEIDTDTGTPLGESIKRARVKK